MPKNYKEQQNLAENYKNLQKLQIDVFVIYCFNKLSVCVFGVFCVVIAESAKNSNYKEQQELQ